MASPLTIGTTATVIAPKKTNRADLRLQNVGSTTLYIKKIPLSGGYSLVSSSDYEVMLTPTSSSNNSNNSNGNGNGNDNDHSKSGGEAF